MGFLQWKISKSKSILEEEDPSQRSSSLTLPRKRAFRGDQGNADARDAFLIKASQQDPKLPNTPRCHAAAPTASPNPKSIHRSASVVVAATSSKQGVHAHHHPPAPSTKALLPAYKTIAQFRHKVELYKGSISTVYKAQCTLTKTEVIIKQYIKVKMTSRSTRKMKREIRLMYMLESQEGVAQILGDFEDEHHYYIIMEHCAGGDLYHRMILKGEFDEHWACEKVIMPLLRVLHYIHTEAHIVHRDIKPENIFLTRSDELRLGDFGLAIKQDEELPFLRAGTLDYMAPEVLENERVDNFDENPAIAASDLQMVGLKAYDHKVDVWAVGVLAFELLVGEAPFYHADEQETKDRIRKSIAIPFPYQRRMSPWADFVKTALKKDPRQRPTAGELMTHPWVLQHSASPLLFANLPSAAGGVPLGRVVSLRAVAPLALSKPSMALHAQQFKQGTHRAMQQSVQIRVDATSAAVHYLEAAEKLPVRAARVVASAAKDVAQNLLLPAPEGEDAAARAKQAEPQHSTDSLESSMVCMDEGSSYFDDLKLDKRVSLVDLRRTRSTGEAHLTPVHPHQRSESSTGSNSTPPEWTAGAEVVFSDHETGASLAAATAVGSRAIFSTASTSTTLEAAAVTIATTFISADSILVETHSETPLLAAAQGAPVAHPIAIPGDGTSQSASLTQSEEQDDFFEATSSSAESSLNISDDGSRRASSISCRRSEMAGDAVDAFSAQQAQCEEVQQAQHDEEQQASVPAPTAATKGSPSKSLAVSLPPALPDIVSISFRPKSHSIPKSVFASKPLSLFSSSPPPLPPVPSSTPPSPNASPFGALSAQSACHGTNAAGVSGAQGSTSAGSKILAAWGRKPSRLSAANGSPTSSSGAAGTSGGPGEQATVSAASKGMKGWTCRGGSIMGTISATEEEGKGAKSGSINRLKLYLSRQRGV